MEQQPEKNSPPPRELPLASEWPWMLRYSLIFLATFCTVVVLAVAFKSPSTLKAGANSQPPVLPPPAVPTVPQSQQIYLENKAVPEIKQGSQTGIIQSHNSTVAKPEFLQKSAPKTTAPLAHPSPSPSVGKASPQPSSTQGQTQPIQTSPSPVFSIFNAPPITNDQLLIPQEGAANPELSPTVTIPTPQEPSQAALLAQTNPEQPRTQSASNQSIQLTLRQIVILAVENNTEIKNAYLERFAQQEDLALAESRFSPTITPNISVQIARNRFGSSVANTGSLGLSAGIEVKIPTGGAFTFSWAANAQTPQNSVCCTPTADNNTLKQNFQLSFTQPLLRGAGVEINRVPVEIAKLNEDSNIENLKLILINKITEAIKAYRNLLQAQKQLEIAQDSLRRAKDTREILLALIQAGRRARVESFQSEAQVANQELSLLAAENELESARLTLVNLLNINRNLKVVAGENLMIAQPTLLDAEKLMQLALENRPDYVRSRLNQRIAELELVQAEDNRRWNLDLNVKYGANYNSLSADSTQVSAGLTLQQTLGDRTPERDFQRSRIKLLQTENSTETKRENLQVEVKNQIRQVELNFRRVGAAQKARQLSEENLAIAQEKLKLGTSDIFQIVDFQQRLLSARGAELTAIIDYLNALTILDQTLGSTLETWQVTIERK